jgi:transcription elongation regulator 1
MQWPPGPPEMQAPRPRSLPTGAPPQQGGPGVGSPTQGARSEEREEAGKGMVDVVQGEVTKGGKEKKPESEKAAKAWTAHKNDEGVAYYYNSVTGESTYEKPKGFVGEVRQVAPKVMW